MRGTNSATRRRRKGHAVKTAIRSPHHFLRRQLRLTGHLSSSAPLPSRNSNSPTGGASSPPNSAPASPWVRLLGIIGFMRASPLGRASAVSLASAPSSRTHSGETQLVVPTGMKADEEVVPESDTPIAPGYLLPKDTTLAKGQLIPENIQILITENNKQNAPSTSENPLTPSSPLLMAPTGCSSASTVLFRSPLPAGAGGAPPWLTPCSPSSSDASALTLPPPPPPSSPPSSTSLA